jgi:hypothetical protein
MTDYHLLKSGHKEFFPYWDQENIISIGWEDASKLVYEGAPDSDVREVCEKYHQSPGYVLNVLKCFAGRSGGDRTPMSEGDIVIVDGQKDIRGESVIRGVAEIGEIKKWDTRIDDEFPHLLYREVEWCYNDGPVAKKELSAKFQMRGSASTHLPSTIQQWNPDGDAHTALQELVEDLKDAPLIQPKTYDFEFSERVIQEHIADHPEQFQEDLEISSGKIEQEYRTKSGDFADFVVLPSGDEITVVETKIDAAGPKAAKQLREYIEDLRTEHDEHARGVLVAEEFYDYEGIEEEIGDHDITIHRYHVTLDYEQVQMG